MKKLLYIFLALCLLMLGACHTKTCELKAVGEGMGTVTINGADESQSKIKTDSKVTLFAAPSEGWEFSGWYSDDEKISDEQEYIFIIKSDTSLTARFKEILYFTVTVDAEEGGIVTGGGIFKENDQLTVIAIPAEEMRFLGWYAYDELVSMEAEYTFNIKSDISLTARFKEIICFTVIVEAVGNGTVSGGGVFIEGKQIAVNAVPTEDWEFIGWCINGEMISEEFEYIFIIKKDVLLTAHFKETVFFTVVIDINGNGIASGSGKYAENSLAAVAAVPEEGWEFAGWYEDGNLQSEHIEYTFKITDNISLTAVFTGDFSYVEVALNDEAGGIVFGGGYAANNKTTIFTAAANSGYIFYGYYIDGGLASRDATYEVFVDGNMQIRAVFGRFLKESEIMCYEDYRTEGMTFAGLEYGVEMPNMAVLPHTYRGLPIVGIASPMFEAEFVVLGRYVKTVSQGAFSMDGRVNNIYLDDNNTALIVENNIIYSKDYAKLISYPYSGDTEFAVPAAVKEIHELAFINNDRLIHISLGSVEIIGAGAFSFCTSLISINIPDCVRIIEEYAFFGCGSLYALNIDINNSLTEYIGYNAFSYCEKLQSINIGRNVAVIEDGFVNDCPSLATINVHAANERYSSNKGIIFDKKYTYTYVNTKNEKAVETKKTLLRCPEGYRSPALFADDFDGAATIGYMAFLNCNIQIVNLPSSISKILTGAFSNCMELTAVNSLSNVQYIDAGVFYNCAKLINIGSLGGLYYLGRAAFQDSGLTSVTIYARTIDILYDSTFAGCKDLRTVTFPSSTFTNIRGIGHDAFADCISLRTISLPTSIWDRNAQSTALSPTAFSGCVQLTDININASLTSYSLGRYYSKGGIVYRYNRNGNVELFICPEGKSGTITVQALGSIQASVIGDFAFANCAKVTAVNMNGSIERVGVFSFAYCTALTQIDLGAKINYIGDAAFWGCENLLKVMILAETPPYAGFSAFEQCGEGFEFVFDERYKEAYKDGSWLNMQKLPDFGLL